VRARATEQRNSRTRGLDLRSTREIVAAINREDARVARAVGHEIAAIAKAADAMANSLANGGRVFYVGAGTSGRLATLDAAELPPTFGVSRHIVQAIVAGGKRALTEAVEGAEDSGEQGSLDLAARGVSKRDVVVGIAASGGTPYVTGALQHARRAGATTVGITSNRKSAIADIADILIAPETGPEVILGSTRMKAGTAQKMVLNMLSTAAMVRLGRVYDNWMIGVAQTNAKLKVRAAQILEEASGADARAAGHALRESEHDLRVALIMLKRKVDAKEARLRLRRAKDNLREALGESRRARH
jgi:N-acetylmuramic acid 6-phosphate etherase